MHNFNSRISALLVLIAVCGTILGCSSYRVPNDIVIASATPNDKLAAAITLWNVNEHAVAEALAAGADPNILMCQGFDKRSGKMMGVVFDKSYSNSNSRFTKCEIFAYTSLIGVANSGDDDYEKIARIIRLMAKHGARTKDFYFQIKDGQPVKDARYLIYGGIAGSYKPGDQELWVVGKMIVFTALIDAGLPFDSMAIQEVIQYLKNGEDSRLELWKRLSAHVGLSDVFHRELREKQERLARSEELSINNSNTSSHKNVIRDAVVGEKKKLPPTLEVGMEICRTSSNGSEAWPAIIVVAGFVEQQEKDRIQIRVSDIRTASLRDRWRDGSLLWVRPETLQYRQSLLRHGSIIWDAAVGWERCAY